MDSNLSPAIYSSFSTPVPGNSDVGRYNAVQEGTSDSKTLEGKPEITAIDQVMDGIKKTAPWIIAPVLGISLIKGLRRQVEKSMATASNNLLVNMLRACFLKLDAFGASFRDREMWFLHMLTLATAESNLNPTAENRSKVKYEGKIVNSYTYGLLQQTKANWNAGVHAASKFIPALTSLPIVQYVSSKLNLSPAFMLRPINELGPTTPSVYQIAPNIGAMLLLKRFLDDNFHYYKGSWIALTQEVAASPLWYGITQNPHYKRILHDYYGGRQLIVTLLHTNGTGFYRTKKIYHQSRLQTDVLIFNQLLSEDTKWSFSQKGDIASGTLPLVTSGYGRRKGSHHSGFDIGGPKGTSVYAVTDGKVTFAGWENYKDKKQGYGRFVQISHPDGKKTVYAHLDSFAVKRGDRVKGGQKIGETDNSGHIMSGDSHLHFEIISNGRKVNPGDYLNTDFDYRRAVSPMYSLISAGASRVDINRKEVIV